MRLLRVKLLKIGLHFENEIFFSIFEETFVI